MASLFLHNEEPDCPMCREKIEGNSPNYDLKQMTDNVEFDSSYWGRRLMEIVHIPGEPIAISDKLRPFAKMLTMRMVYDDTFKELSEIRSDHEIRDIESLRSIMCKAFRRNDVSLDDAYIWVEILSLPERIAIEYKTYLLQWYRVKNFLQEKDALWVMDVFKL
jgi:hypothetical protein